QICGTSDHRQICGTSDHRQICGTSDHRQICGTSDFLREAPSLQLHDAKVGIVFMRVHVGVRQMGSAPSRSAYLMDASDFMGTMEPPPQKTPVSRGVALWTLWWAIVTSVVALIGGSSLLWFLVWFWWRFMC
ncbi:hypothetical protein CYMTET_26944, partial [Cymbomonas tetramitiformis]